MSLPSGGMRSSRANLSTLTGVHDLPLFGMSGLLLAMAPGPDTAYIVGRSSSHGWRGGATAALGIGLGIWIHILAAAGGLSAILMASARAFTIAKLVGAMYLLYLGIEMLIRKHGDPVVSGNQGRARASTRQIFWQGFLTNVLNPKVALFFLAFLPQFTDEKAPSKIAALLFLGLVFDVVGTAWNLLVAHMTAHLAARFTGTHSLRAWFDRAIGATLILVGLRVATAERR
jgi:threonine/homoserine/homoserine lactone efflux protein